MGGIWAQWSLPKPPGMVYIPPGTFHMGPSDEDVNYAYTARNKQVSQSGFWMDATEITNNHYRQFVNWVRDSILIYNHLNDPSYFKTSATGESKHIDWERVRKNSPWNAQSQAQQEALNQMYYQGEDRIFGKNELDVRQLTYHYEWYDLRAAVAAKNCSPAPDTLGIHKQQRAARLHLLNPVPAIVA